ncbi:hypothetical protein ACUOA8_59020 [Escherichia sp. SS-MK2]
MGSSQMYATAQSRETGIAVTCRFFLIAFFLRAVATHRRDALFRRGF